MIHFTLPTKQIQSIQPVKLRLSQHALPITAIQSKNYHAVLRLPEHLSIYNKWIKPISKTHYAQNYRDPQKIQFGLGWNARWVYMIQINAWIIHIHLQLRTNYFLPVLFGLTLWITMYLTISSKWILHAQLHFWKKHADKTIAICRKVQDYWEH